MNDYTHPAERRGPRALSYGGRPNQSVDPNHPARLMAMTGEATTDRMSERMREMARFCDAGEENVEGLMVNPLRPGKTALAV